MKTSESTQLLKAALHMALPIPAVLFGNEFGQWLISRHYDLSNSDIIERVAFSLCEAFDWREAFLYEEAGGLDCTPPKVQIDQIVFDYLLTLNGIPMIYGQYEHFQFVYYEGEDLRDKLWKWRIGEHATVKGKKLTQLAEMGDVSVNEVLFRIRGGWVSMRPAPEAGAGLQFFLVITDPLS
jgi:hypothetical protein